MGQKKAFRIYKDSAAKMEAASWRAVRDANRAKKRLSPSFRRRFMLSAGYRGWTLCGYQYVDENEYGRFPDVELTLRHITGGETDQIIFKGVHEMDVECLYKRDAARRKEAIVSAGLKKRKKTVVCRMLFSSGMRIWIRCKKIKMRK